MALDLQQAGDPTSQSDSAASNGQVVVTIDPNDSDGDEECFARTQVKNLLWIEKSEPHKKAQEYWNEQYAFCHRRVDSKRKQSSAVWNEVYLVIGFYSVFQGVLLTAFSQSNLLQCNDWWDACSLSALASLVALFVIILKFRSIQKLERTIASEKASRQLFVARGQRLLDKGPNFRFHKDAKDGEKTEGRNWKLAGSFTVVIVVLILFSGAFLKFIRRVLCNPGHSRLPPSR